MSIQISYVLGPADWNQERGGWLCDACRLPGARVTLRKQAKTLPPEDYRVEPKEGMILWLSQKRPQRIRAIISIKKPLVTAKWRKLAIVLPFVGTLLGALIHEAFPLLLSQPKKVRERVARGLTAYEIRVLPNGVFSLWWPEAPTGVGDAEAHLKKAGVDIAVLKDGVRSLLGGLAAQPRERVTLTPSRIEIPGLCWDSSGARPDSESGYDFYTLGLKDGYVSVALGVSSEPEPLPLTPEKRYGINWEQVRSGLKKILDELYKAQDVSTDIDMPGVFIGPDKEQEYELRYRLIGP